MFLRFVLANPRAGIVNLHNHLLSRQKSVCDELSCSDSDRLVGVGSCSHVCEICTAATGRNDNGLLVRCGFVNISADGVVDRDRSFRRGHGAKAKSYRASLFCVLCWISLA